MTDWRLLPIYSPVLTRGEDVLPLPMLGTYSQRQAEERARRLNALRDRSVVPPV
ncbi:hypothetical protein [Actinoplanes sp. NPDC026670]|uniref:hypothetical protein n=1 Tax=Actinoplanes sp. NPDC026670 TaxID=3154700 RepID=UPI0033FFEB81